jgi:helicase
MLGLEEAADNVIDFLLEEEMIRSVDGRLVPTFFGRRVSDLYIDPLTAVKLRDALRNFKPGGSPFGLLHAVCSSPDMLTMYLKRSDYEWVEEVYATREGELLLPPGDLDEFDFYLAELKTACSIDDWIMEMEEDELLKKYGIGPGDLRNKMDVGEWLIYSMRELSNIFNKDAYPVLTELMVRIRYGVRPELLDLVRLRGVGRARARSLFNHGIRSVEDIQNVDPVRLARIPKIGDSVAKSLLSQVGGSRFRKDEEVPAEEIEEVVIEEKRPSDGKQRSLLDF